MSRRVVITGLGLTCALGNSVGQSVARAFAGESGIGRCDERLMGEYGARLPIRIGGLVSGLDPSAYVDARFARTYDPTIVFALAATREALDDAALSFDASLRERTGVLLGCSAPGIHSLHRASYAAFVEMRAHELPAYSLMQFSGNMPAAIVALTHGLRGPNVGIVNACASGGTTLGIAADYVRYGRCDVAIAGGTEACLNVSVFGALASVRAANPTCEPDRACRPFAKDRAGLVLGEGAGVLVLETLERAVARGARIYGEILGDAQTNDAHHVISPEPNGESWARTIRLALEQAGVEPEEVDYVSAHAASTVAGDLAETRALKLVFGEHARRLAVSATKSMHGHTFGASGAIEMVLALAAMRRGWVLPTINMTTPDPDCDLDYVPEPGRTRQTRVLLKNSFGFGGTNSCTIIRGGN